LWGSLSHVGEKESPRESYGTERAQKNHPGKKVSQLKHLQPVVIVYHSQLIFVQQKPFTKI
ncbi:MAG: hypothetical protein ACK40Q_06545, partial [Pseudothermotoga sp.]